MPATTDPPGTTRFNLYWLRDCPSADTATAVGLALITTLLNARTDLHIVRLHEAVGWGRQAAVERLLEAGLLQPQRLDDQRLGTRAEHLTSDRPGVDLVEDHP